MQNVKKFAFFVAFVVSIGCGGSLVGDWDEFEPRATTTTDLRNRSFAFSWLPDGNPLDSDMDAFSMAFGDFGDDATAPVSVSESGKGTASGIAELTDGVLEIDIDSAIGETELRPGDRRELKIESDESDGRIRLTRESDGVEATSDPRETE